MMSRTGEGRLTEASHLTLADVRDGFPVSDRTRPSDDDMLRQTELLARAYTRRTAALQLLAEEAASGYTPGAPLHQDYKTQLAGILPWSEDASAWEAFDLLTRLAGQRFDAAQFADAWPGPVASDALCEAEDAVRQAAIGMIRSDDLTPRR